MHIEIRPEPFDPLAEAALYQNSLPSGSYGASSLFIGTMRDFNLNDSVNAMFLEHYPGMTEKELESLVHKTLLEHDVIDALVIHRIGNLIPGEPIVLVAVWSAHRRAAFDACRQIMELLKSKATFWKKEILQDSARWVDRNTPG